MGNIGKTFALILMLIIAMSSHTLLIVKPANATALNGNFTSIVTPRPEDLNYPPEFSLTLNNGSEDIDFINGTIVNSTNFSIGVSAVFREIPIDCSLMWVTYQASWQNVRITIYRNPIDMTHITDHTFGPTKYYCLINFTNVPFGENRIEFMAQGNIIYCGDNGYNFTTIYKLENITFKVDPSSYSPEPSSTALPTSLSTTFSNFLQTFWGLIFVAVILSLVVALALTLFRRYRETAKLKQ
jgi:hypothetical protein